MNLPRRSAPNDTAAASDSIIAPGTLSGRGLIGLYVHIPYCQTKCGYCDFYSVATDGQDVDRVLGAILSELVRRIEDGSPGVDTVFIGGGTPTVLSVDQLRPLLAAVGGVLPAGGPIEYTVEANPATVDREKAALLRRSGVTRVSLGAQSFDAAELAWLERLHTPGDIAPAVALLRAAGITEFNIDLMFGIGGQSLASWRRSLERALDLQPTHIACYGLTYEPGTPLTGRLNCGAVTRCDEQLETDMYLTAIDVLDNAGFEHYEISNFARPGHACLHNLVYWNNGSYIGVGPSAAGYIAGRRYKNIAHANRYADRVHAGRLPEIDSETVTGDAFAVESLMLGLRQIRGIELDSFCARTGVDLARRAAGTLAALHADRLLETAGGFLRLTREGLLAADAVIAQLAAAIDTTAGMSLPVVRVSA